MSGCRNFTAHRHTGLGAARAGVAFAMSEAIKLQARENSWTKARPILRRDSLQGLDSTVP
jgi:hypothetical protein